MEFSPGLDYIDNICHELKCQIKLENIRTHTTDMVTVLFAILPRWYGETTPPLRGTPPQEGNQKAL